VKKEIHPAYEAATITCACGNSIRTRSTKQNLRVEICSACHPFYTGTRSAQTVAGRVERFKKKYAKKSL
jgi:large subunit ribosomal protein L31